MNDALRLQLTISKSSATAHFGNAAGFALAPASSASFVWRIYPVGGGGIDNQSSYFDFINSVRRDLIPTPPTVEGGAWVPYDFAVNWTSARLTSLLVGLGLPGRIILCGPLRYGGFPWLGQVILPLFPWPLLSTPFLYPAPAVLVC